jgi:hypothetical protein
VRGADPDLYHNVRDPDHCLTVRRNSVKYFYTSGSEMFNKHMRAFALDKVGVFLQLNGLSTSI